VGTKRNGCLAAAGRPPGKPALGKPLVAQPETLAVVNQDLHRRGPPIAKHEHPTAQRVVLEHLLAEPGQAVAPLRKSTGSTATTRICGVIWSMTRPASRPHALRRSAMAGGGSLLRTFLPRRTTRRLLWPASLALPEAPAQDRQVGCLEALQVAAQLRPAGEPPPAGQEVPVALWCPLAVPHRILC